MKDPKTKDFITVLQGARNLIDSDDFSYCCNAIENQARAQDFYAGPIINWFALHFKPKVVHSSAWWPHNCKASRLDALNKAIEKLTKEPNANPT